jgi:hypothetical protein
LTSVEVETLINSCPVACKVTCGSLLVFETNITFRLLHVDNFLAPESTLLFEEATSQYTTKYVLSKNEKSTFSLNNVELLSQKIIEKNGGDRRSLRSLQESEKYLVDLQVYVAFRGFALETSLETVEMLILEGITTFGYMRALRFTNDPALLAVDVAPDVDPKNSPTSERVSTTSKDTGPSPWKVTVTVLASVTMATLVILCVIRKKSNMVPSKSEEKNGSPDLSPAASTRSALATNFSYDSIVRFASVALSPRSETPTSFACSSENGSDLKSSPNTSLVSTVESIEEEHPLTGVIPPMIVYDYIERDDGPPIVADQPCPKKKMKDVVPSRHVTATSSFREALQRNSLESLDKSTFVGIPTSLSANSFEEISKDEVRIGLTANNTKTISFSESDANGQSCTLKDLSELTARKKSDRRKIACRQEITKIRNLDNEGYQIVLTALRTRKMGLVIQCAGNHGPVVLQVKDYSPFQGDLLPGDRILSIDGEDTVGISLKEVTELMSGSSTESRRWDSILQVLVWRPHHERNNMKEISETSPTPFEFQLPSGSTPKPSGHQRATSHSSMRSISSAPPSSYQWGHLSQNAITSIASSSKTRQKHSPSRASVVRSTVSRTGQTHCQTFSPNKSSFVSSVSTNDLQGRNTHSKITSSKPLHVRSLSRDSAPSLRELMSEPTHRSTKRSDRDSKEC